MNNEERMKDLSIENARLIFRNFSGKKDSYNPAGKREFTVVVSPEDGQALSDAGWYVKFRTGPDGEEYDPTFKIRLNFASNNPPKIWLKAGNKKPELLTEETVGVLDYAEIEKADLIVSPYAWEFNGKHGISAYLKKLYVTIPVDRFEEQFFDDDNEEAPY